MALQTAVVGAGTISDVHLTGASKNPRTDLVAVCDVDEHQARRTAREYDIRPYTSVDELVTDLSLDLLHVCTPVQTHLDVARTAAEAGISLIIEKPVTETVAELGELADLADEHGIAVTPVHNHRFDHAVLRARDLIEAGTLGRIRGLDLVFAGHTRPDAVNRGSWVFDLPGGEFEEGLPHPIYLALGLGGYPTDPAEISVTTALAGEYDRSFDYDTVQVQYPTPDERLCSLKMVAGGQPKRVIHVHGEDATITIDILLQMVQVVDSDYRQSPISLTKQALAYAAGRVTGVTRNARTVLETTLGDDWAAEREGSSHYRLFDRTVRAIEAGDAMPVPLSSARWTLETMQAIREAAAAPPVASSVEPDPA